MAAKAKKAAKKAARTRTPAASPPNASELSGAAEKAGVGTKTHPANKRIPDKAIIRREGSGLDALGVQPAPTVKGDQTLQVLDVLQGTPVEVFLLRGKPLNKKDDGRLVFVQGSVSNGLFPAAVARSKFAVKPDGTALYNSRGFDDVVGAEFNLLDVVELIEHNNK